MKKQKTNMKNLIIRSFLLLIPLSSCQSSINKKRNFHEVSLYKQKVQSFNCQKLADEMAYINENLNLINKQIKNSFFDSFMEVVVSIGIYSSGKDDLRDRVVFFEQKQEIISINQKERFCHEK